MVSSPWQNVTFLETECLVNLTIINPTNNNVVSVAYVNVTSEPLFAPLEPLLISLEYNQAVLITVSLYSTYIYFLSLSRNVINGFFTHSPYTTEEVFNSSNL